MTGTMIERGNKIAAGYAAMVADFVAASEDLKHDKSPYAAALVAAYAAFAAGYGAASAAAEQAGATAPFPLLPLPDSSANPAPLDVLTLAETAEYLRVPENTVRAEAEAKRLPGRKLGEEWRFVRVAVVDWLRAEQPTAEHKPKSSKERMLTAYGAWKDFGEDPEEVIAELYRARKALSAKKG
ncbi:MAG: helix-turn-helix domain-containing protein [Planctomycetia bacterium]|nr:helix-turn-helix domain-containing protein [Planctomycetia bacterium]